CLRKQPGERYPSAEALADDLGRYLNAETVIARHLSGRELLGRWLREHFAAKMLGVAALYLLLAAVVDAQSNRSFMAVPLTTVVLVPFLWPRKATCVISSSLTVFFILVYAMFIPADMEILWGAALNIGLSVGRGLLLGLVGLAVSRRVGRDRVSTTLG